MPSTDFRKTLPAATALVLPIVVLKLATAFLGTTGAGVAQASPNTPAPAVAAGQTHAQPVKYTEKQLAAAKHVESLRSQPFGPAPFMFVKGQPEAVQPETTPIAATSNVEPASIPQESPAPTFILRAIMSSSKGSRALINGRPYQEGEQIKDTTWIVATIDGPNRSVVIRDSQSDRSATLSVEQPK